MKIKSNYPINEKSILNIQNLMKEYDILKSIEISQDNSQEKIYLQDSIENTCRFCNKQKPNITFKNVSHAIPEFLGNKSLISKYECDDCNKYFSQFENEFANLMLPLNTFANTKNKKNKSPKYKNKIEIYQDFDNEIKIKNFPDNLIVDKNEIDFH